MVLVPAYVLCANRRLIDRRTAIEERRSELSISQAPENIQVIVVRRARAQPVEPPSKV
jgi:hypothetical protein